MTLLEAALSYAERGIPVFPLHPRSKAPLGHAVPNGKDDASHDFTLPEDADDQYEIPAFLRKSAS